MSVIEPYNDTTEPNDMSVEGTEPTADAEKPEAVEPSESEQAQVKKLLKTIHGDEAFHKKAFERMGKSMFMAFHGRDKTYAETNYKANIAGRHVKQKTAALYAKNPKATAKRNERMDFTIWDENPKSLDMAVQITQKAQQALAIAAQQTAATPPDPITGVQVPVQPQIPPGFEQAQALIADFQQGTQYQQLVERIGKTLEILFARALRDQEPLDFKMAAKALVRRACTCGVGYVELGFVRQYGPRTGIDDELADARARLDHLRRLSEEYAEGDIDEDDAEMNELETSIAALTSEPEIVLREGLTFDFPEATKVIPDKLTKQLVGFVGARHLAIKYLFTCDEVEEMFPDADIKAGGYKGYGSDGVLIDGPSQSDLFDEDEESSGGDTDYSGKGLVCVYKFYDKMTGLCSYVADGHKKFLRPVGPPDVFVEKFWPVFALTFNAVESEDELYPKSDVELMADQQMEHNRSRQGMREHRIAARPRWGTSKGILDEEGITAIKGAVPFDVVEFNKDPQTKLVDVFEPFPVPGVDPNLYGTDQYDEDTQLVVGSQSAQMGAVSKATATESAIAANSTQNSDDSSKDDLDAFLSQVARAGSQILFREMSEAQVKEIVGPGAVWPEQTLAQIANEVYLEVEAGSTGRPNQAIQIENFTKMAPFLLQLPELDKVWLAKYAAKTLDDNIDINAAILSNAPSIVAQNQQTQPGTGDPATDPNQQGAQGGNNAPTQPQPESPGSGPAFGSNQVSRPAA